jgi:hypothetical protein
MCASPASSVPWSGLQRECGAVLAWLARAQHWLAGQESVVVAGCAHVDTMCSNVLLEHVHVLICMVTR